MTQTQGSAHTNQVSDKIETISQDTETPSVVEPKTEDKVAYDTYRRVLSEKKKMQERLETLEREQKTKQEQELKEQNKWKEMFETRNKEVEEYKSKYESLQNQFVVGAKLKAFFGQLQGQVEEKYWDKIDESKIVLDPETQEPDLFSVKKYVEEFVKTYPEIIRSANSPKVPNNAPQSNSPLSYEEWIKLPTKEMIKRQKEVQN